MGRIKVKTAAQRIKEHEKAAKDLPVETKRKFWEAMTKNKKNVGEAREIAGIDDVMVAAQLVIQCHKEIYIPMSVEDIT